MTTECQIYQHPETRPSRRCTCGSLYCEGTFIPPRSIPPLLPESFLWKGFPAAPTSCCQLHRCPTSVPAGTWVNREDNALCPMLALDSEVSKGKICFISLSL